MAAVRLWVRADLRRRWLSWVVLGVLAGLVVGLAAAAAAGARRTHQVVSEYEAVSAPLDAGVLANDPEFGAEQRRAVAELPYVTSAASFGIFFVEADGNGAFWPGLAPADRVSAGAMRDVYVDGRPPRAAVAGETSVDENARDDLGLGIGSRFPVVGEREDGSSYRTSLRVVGITKSVQQGSYNWTPSAGFYIELAGAGVPHFTNMFVGLRRGSPDVERLERDVAEITGKSVSIMDLSLERLSTRSSTDLEARGLWLFAAAVLLGGGALVGQALARSVSTGAAELPTWSAMGADRTKQIAGLVIPAILTAAVAVGVGTVVAILLSPRFPIGVSRRFALDLGVRVDGPVLALAAFLTVAAVVGGALLVAWWRVVSGEARSVRASTVGRLATISGAPPALAIGTRLALEPGRGRRAVPVRSALIGAIAGVLGVVACFTFRAGIDDATTNPQRSGIVWDTVVSPDEGPIPRAVASEVVGSDAVASAIRTRWVRSVTIGGRSVPTWAAAPAKGDMEWVVLAGRAPRAPDEVAFGPDTMSELGLRVGDRTTTGGGTALRVVGEALLPASTHTANTEGAWLPRSGLAAAQPDADARKDGDDVLLVRWAPGGDVGAVTRAVGEEGIPVEPAVLPADVQSLREMYALPLVLGVFLALLAVATLAHALVTTVRRRRHELAVLRALGFTRRQSRVAIAWQATLLVVIGLVVGVPLGVVFGRVAWQWLADSFPFVYVPPIALAATLLVIPVALVVANLLAAGPGRRAARIQPAAVLRSE